MSEHKNVSGVDLDLSVDGLPYFAEAGESVTIPDEFDYQLAEQPAWAIVSVPTKSAPAASTPAVVPDITTTAAAASEGAN